MFSLISLENEVRVPPEQLQRPHPQAVTSQLRKMYTDKVVGEHGLCVGLYDVQGVEGGFVFPSDGAPHFTVKFRLVMFKPFVGEILSGKLISCDVTGLYVSLGFFSDIHIPEHLLQAPSEFDAEEKLWVWKFSGNDMFMDLEEEIRFRVASVKFPPVPVMQEKGAKPFAPLQITGDINADGLGLISWWS